MGGCSEVEDAREDHSAGPRGAWRQPSRGEGSRGVKVAEIKKEFGSPLSGYYGIGGELEWSAKSMRGARVELAELKREVQALGSARVELSNSGGSSTSAGVEVKNADFVGGKQLEQEARAVETKELRSRSMAREVGAQPWRQSAL